MRLNEILELYCTNQIEPGEYQAAKMRRPRRPGRVGLTEAVDIEESTSRASIGSIHIGQTIREAWDLQDPGEEIAMLDLLIGKVVIYRAPKTPGYAPHGLSAGDSIRR